jgi:hypothetical protein
MLLRRRRSPTYWSDDELTAQIRATYVSQGPFVADAQGEVNLAAVVFHQDPDLLPRKLIRYANRAGGGFVPFCVYGVWWNDYLSTSVAMGDEPYDTFRIYSGHDSEPDARHAAKEWLRSEGDDDVRDVAFAELPVFAQGMVRYVLRRGPGYFE